MHELLVHLRRDSAGDCCRDGISFRGFRFSWPDGTPVRTGLSRLCGVGIALLFGRRRLVPDECLLRLCCAATTEDALPRRPAPGVRVLRLYLQREGSRGVLHFHNGHRTEVVFEDGVDEPRVLRWVGMAGLPDGGRVWLDLFALPCALPPRGDPASAVWGGSEGSGSIEGGRVGGPCDGCGGHGCPACEGNGWLLAGHPGVRRCGNCGASLPPSQVAVYCSNECALAAPSRA
jgi:hypothetical protein